MNEIRRKKRVVFLELLCERAEDLEYTRKIDKLLVEHFTSEKLSGLEVGQILEAVEEHADFIIETVARSARVKIHFTENDFNK